MNRVVVTGMAGLCPLGQDWPAVREALLAGRSAIRRYDDWARVQDLKTHLGAEVPDFARPSHYSRKRVRSMGRVSLLATRATELALEQAGLQDADVSRPGVGLAYGSTSGSPPALGKFATQLFKNTVEGLTGAEFLQSMSHTTAINLAQFFGIQGRIIPTCSACTSGSQAIGYAYECVKAGFQDVMISGGAEELHFAGAAVFDIMLATSTRNDEPHLTPRPFDRDRDGLVVGEGAGTLILESLDHARGRDATILAEVAGFSSNCDGLHVVNPSAEGMQSVMEAALASAELAPDAIDYVNAHATSTEVGDIAESQATRECFGRAVPISSLKSYMGHTLGACGALEAWISIHQMHEGWLAPTINLDAVDERCAELDYLTKVRETKLSHIMSNNFAFGGINTSLIIKQYRD